jgi:myosin-crossreactive antigen
LTTTAIKCRRNNSLEMIKVGARDLVFVTTGSIVEDTAYGDADTDLHKPGMFERQISALRDLLKGH